MEEVKFPKALTRKSSSQINSVSTEKLANKDFYKYLTHAILDLCFVVNKLSQFLSALTTAHWRATKHVLRYLKGTLHHCIHIKHSTGLTLTGFSDADWACCPDDRKSVAGYCVYLGHTLVSGSSKKQVVVSHSSTKPEYRSFAHVVAKIS
ncbi:uncharacterized mitochondrial protein AtMg00240-like [Humulus lupulus]|uniref:uncharacterized mitochondrial protein AtMg00240-like n=1 Tax=Humulus lupulus TaxID=3486 RepID=UPI002B412394|nr:uncharacterized mitochondrial protein AtMg00240-like [Humulus lupulus]